MPILENLWIIPLLPLLGSAINGLFGAKWSKTIVNSVALGSTGISFLCAVEAVREFLKKIRRPTPTLALMGGFAGRTRFSAAPEARIRTEIEYLENGARQYL